MVSICCSHGQIIPKLCKCCSLWFHFNGIPMASPEYKRLKDHSLVIMHKIVLCLWQIVQLLCAHISHNFSDVWLCHVKWLYLRYRKVHESKQWQVSPQVVNSAVWVICVLEHSVWTPSLHSDPTNQVQAGELQSSTFMRVTSIDNRLLANNVDGVKIPWSCSWPSTASMHVEMFLSLVIGKKNLQTRFCSITFTSTKSARLTNNAELDEM